LVFTTSPPSRWSMVDGRHQLDPRIEPEQSASHRVSPLRRHVHAVRRSQLE